MVQPKLPEPFFFEKGKRAILLLHGYTGTSSDVRMLGRALERADYTVYAPHFSGHGTINPDDILAATPADWWEDTKAALRFLKEKGYQEIAVIGFSLGGILAMKAAEEESLVGVGTLCSPIYLDDDSVIQQTFLTYFKQVKAYAGVAEADVKATIPQVTEKLQQQLKEVRVMADIVQEKLPQVKIPSLICQSGKDTLVAPINAEKLRSALINSSISFHLYKNSTHVVTVGPEHHLLEADVVAYLDQLSWSNEV